MSIESPSLEQMYQALDLISEIAEKAATVEGIPLEVDQALDKIISLARYKSNVIGAKLTPKT
nr:hypothetical protein [Brucella intermedia]